MSEPAKPSDPDYDPVLAAMENAPFVELTDEERALLDEAESLHTHWLSTEEFMAALRQRADEG